MTDIQRLFRADAATVSLEFVLQSFAVLFIVELTQKI